MRRGGKRRVPRTVRPDAAERLTRRRVGALVANLGRVSRAVLLPALPTLVAQGPHGATPGPFTDTLEAGIKAARGAWSRQVPDHRIAADARMGALETSKIQRRGWERQLAAVNAGAKTFAKLPAKVLRRDAAVLKVVGTQVASAGEASLLDDAVRQSVNLIKGVAAGRFFDQLHGAIRDGILAGDRHEELAKHLEESFFGDGADALVGASKRAALIARDQTLKLYGNLARIRQTSVGISSYTWRTARDERVRPVHADREGEIFSWDDPPEGGAVGQDYNCRCVAEPVFSDEGADDENEGTDDDSDPFSPAE